MITLDDRNMFIRYLKKRTWVVKGCLCRWWNNNTTRLFVSIVNYLQRSSFFDRSIDRSINQKWLGSSNHRFPRRDIVRRWYTPTERTLTSYRLHYGIRLSYCLLMRRWFHHYSGFNDTYCNLYVFSNIHSLLYVILLKFGFYKKFLSLSLSLFLFIVWYVIGHFTRFFFNL